MTIETMAALAAGLSLGGGLGLGYWVGRLKGQAEGESSARKEWQPIADYWRAMAGWWAAEARAAMYSWRPVRDSRPSPNCVPQLPLMSDRFPGLTWEEEANLQREKMGLPRLKLTLKKDPN